MQSNNNPDDDASITALRRRMRASYDHRLRDRCFLGLLAFVIIAGVRWL